MAALAHFHGTELINLTNTGILGTVIEIAREKIKTVEPSQMFSVAVRTGKTTSEPCTKVELNDGEVHFVKESPQENVEMIFAEAQAAANGISVTSEQPRGICQCGHAKCYHAWNDGLVRSSGCLRNAHVGDLLVRCACVKFVDRNPKQGIFARLGRWIRRK